jgi:hypothetical protein
MSTPAVHRALAVAVLAAALSAGLTACGILGGTTGKAVATTGGKTTSAGAAGNPLAGLSADEIANKAVADSEMAATVRISGRIADSGTTIAMNVGIVRSRGCAGSMSESSNGSFLILRIGQTIWIKPDNKFWVHSGASTPDELRLVSGKVAKSNARGGLATAMAALCDVKQLLGGAAKATGLVKGTTTKISGQNALQLKDAAGSSSVYVSVAADPELLNLTAPGSAQLDFTGYGVPVALTPPPASETIDGAKYGF